MNRKSEATLITCMTNYYNLAIFFDYFQAFNSISPKRPFYIVCLNSTNTQSRVQTFNSCTKRLGVCQCLVVEIPIDNMSKNKPNTSMTHGPCDSKLCSVVRSCVHPWPGNWVAIGLAVVYYARAALAI